jgi:HEPN domain-containing protein
MSIDEEKARLAQSWLNSAHEDLQAVNRLSRPPELIALAAYHCQQAVEKALKGFLLWNDQPFRKTHNLVELVEQCAKVDPEFSDLRLTAETLTPFGTEARYPDTQLVLDLVALNEAQQLAIEAVAFVQEKLPLNLSSDGGNA